MTVDNSLLQILAAADPGDADDVATRAGLFAALRGFGAGNVAVTGRDAGTARARYRPRRRRRASCDAKFSCGARWPSCRFPP
jgi:hypothetical protein